MRIFVLTLLVSTVTGVGLWNFGFAQRIWPGHALLATIILAALCGIVAQLLLTYDAARDRERS